MFTAARGDKLAVLLKQFPLVHSSQISLCLHVVPLLTLFTSPGSLKDSACACTRAHVCLRCLANKGITSCLKRCCRGWTLVSLITLLILLNARTRTHFETHGKIIHTHTHTRHSCQIPILYGSANLMIANSATRLFKLTDRNPDLNADADLGVFLKANINMYAHMPLLTFSESSGLAPNIQFVASATVGTATSSQSFSPLSEPPATRPSSL